MSTVTYGRFSCSGSTSSKTAVLRVFSGWDKNAGPVNQVVYFRQAGWTLWHGLQGCAQWTHNAIVVAVCSSWSSEPNCWHKRKSSTFHYKCSPELPCCLYSDILTLNVSLRGTELHHDHIYHSTTLTVVWFVLNMELILPCLIQSLCGSSSASEIFI